MTTQMSGAPARNAPTGMLPLNNYEIQKASESPTVGADMWEFIMWGWWAFVYNYVNDLVTYGSRKRKLAETKAATLPTVPTQPGMVCPRCLYILKRP
jgi:hypothetical protein